MKDRAISMAQFAAMEHEAKWHANEPRRRKRRDNRDRKREVELAILSAKARELGVQVVRGDWWQRSMFRPHDVLVNAEVVLHVDHRGPYAYLALSRSGAFRGRFTPAEVLALVEALRAARLPYRKPHESRGKARATRG